MISTSECCTSDYYSSSDLEYDVDVVKAAPQSLPSTNEISIIFQALLQCKYSLPCISQLSIKVQQSKRLIQIVRDYNLSNEIFIQANAILQHYLIATCTNEVDESILLACLSLATKLNEHSTHSSQTIFNSEILIFNETLICNTLDWDIHVITPVNYVEAALLYVANCSIKDHLRRVTHDLIVSCLTDVHCVDLSALSIGMGCLLMGCKIINCYDLIPKQVFEHDDQHESS